MGHTLRITRGGKHKSTLMGNGVFLHASGGVTYDAVMECLWIVYLYTCEQMEAQYFSRHEIICVNKILTKQSSRRVHTCINGGKITPR